ncbi:glycosyltransferase family A protein [Azohydromonas australica]|uniref:glycosyltransferase family A protein n=1 Tax=Azohydromonas australica TaxID=364039 RepID=UPI000685EF65|nr:glycosyltransferase family A protein [Azohydromonas australica]
MTNEFPSLWNELPMLANRRRDAQQTLESRLLALMHSSDVNKIPAEQIDDARTVLQLRQALLEQGVQDPRDARWQPVAAVQRRILERHLQGRADYYGAAQCEPFDEAQALLREGRDTFLVIKFMDEGPHIRATLASLLTQTRVDLRRVVIVAANNNSTDGSDRIVAETVAEIASAARVIQVTQTTPGGGSTARYGVDRCLATIHHMCSLDGDWSRLQRARIAVTDGDTVYHHEVVHQLCETFDTHQGVDGVMPFLMYKLTAALRFFRNYRAPDEQALARIAAGAEAVAVGFALSNIDAHAQLPRAGRRLDGAQMRLALADGTALSVPLAHRAPDGRRFGVLQDPAGARAFVLEDRQVVLHQAPVTGYDAVLVFMENGGVGPDEQWKWHTMLGHDMFLLWMFRAFGVPEEVVAPDTSDALKMFRCWAFAIGGQHQLSRPGLKIVTGTDYQSGRVLQSVGCLTVLGRADAWAETEVDRLAKMVRNFANAQSVFYGETRSRGLERASGLYLHMTRIQKQVEQQVLSYPDSFFRDVAFPERVVFPLRWLLQNALCVYAALAPAQRAGLEASLFAPMFGTAWTGLRAALLGDATLAALDALDFDAKRDRAEELAETLLLQGHAQAMAFYRQVVTAFLEAHQLAPAEHGWLFEGFAQGRNALKEERPSVDPAAVWQGREFVIDQARGQVVDMHVA